jgi:hypothetical protein
MWEVPAVLFVAVLRIRKSGLDLEAAVVIMIDNGGRDA